MYFPPFNINGTKLKLCIWHYAFYSAELWRSWWATLGIHSHSQMSVVSLLGEQSLLFHTHFPVLFLLYRMFLKISLSIMLYICNLSSLIKLYVASMGDGLVLLEPSLPGTWLHSRSVGLPYPECKLRKKKLKGNLKSREISTVARHP